MDLPVGKTTSSRIVTVLGMHRSGTSAITRGLLALGVRLGDRLHPAWIDNPKGFWEDKDCISINEELLALLGSAYDRIDLGFSISADDPKVLDLRVRAAEVLHNRLQEGGGLWGFKDPRTCRLLPFWKPLLSATGSSLAFVICLRNPMSVARSLNKRNDIAFEKGYLLWLQHVLPILRHTAGTAVRVVVEYDRLLAQPRFELSRLAAALGFEFSSNDAELDSYINEFLEGDLQHNRFSSADLALDPRAPSSILPLYEVLRRVAADELPLDSVEVSEAAAHAQEQLSNSWPALSYINQLEAKLMTAQEVLPQLASMQSKIVDLEKEIFALSNSLSEVQAHAGAVETERSVLQGQLATVQAQIARFESERGALQEELAAMHLRVTALDSEGRTLRDLLAQAEARADAWDREHSALGEELVRRQDRIGLLEAALEIERSEAGHAAIRDQEKIAFLEVALAQERDAETEAQTSSATLRLELDASHAVVARLDAEWQRARAHAQQASDQARITAEKLAALEASSSWRATAPLRKALAGRPRTARFTRRIAKLIWWSVTLQLVKRLRARRRALTSAQPILLSPAHFEVSADPQALGNLPPPAIEQQASFGSQLGDWLGQHHVSPTEKPILFSWLDELLAYYSSLNIGGDAALLLSTISLDGFRPAMRERLDQVVSEILEQNHHFLSLLRDLEESPVFDSQDYSQRISLQADARHAAIHYLLFGELLGIAPSTGFDAVYYMQRHEDLRVGPCNALIHYIRNGALEGRQPISFCAAPVLRPWAADPARENIILAVHETSRTGAPILGWNIAKHLAETYNVFIVRLGGGALTAEFEALSVEVHGPFARKYASEVDVAYGVRPLFEGRRFKYAIVNSIEARPLLKAFSKAGIPTVLLVHEFSSYIWPHKALLSAYQTASEIVFPAPIVARSALGSDPTLHKRPYHIMPQGMSVVPSTAEGNGKPKQSRIDDLSALRASGTMIVLGAGSVEMRKGVDIFLEIASAVQRRTAGRPVHFVWVGGGYRPREDLGYSLYLEEHLNRAGLADHITFLDAVADLDPIYALADVFLLTSRLDPLPNVTIDAAMRGIPIVCFQDASGMADLLLANAETRRGVVPHLDSAAAADVIVELAEDEPQRQSMADATGRFAAEVFDMDHYVAELDRLGSQATVRELAEAATPLAAVWWFDASWYAAHYGVMRDHAGYLSEGLAAGHAPGPLAAIVLARFAPDIRFSPSLYGQFQRAVTWKRSIPKESLRLLAALYVPAWHDAPGIEGFLTFLRQGMAADVKPGPLFDAEEYRARLVTAGLPPIEPGESALSHWLRYGVAARIVPTRRFDEAFYRASNLDLREAPIWGFAHYIEDGAREGRKPNGRSRWYRAPAAFRGGVRLPSAYEAWYDEDFAGADGGSLMSATGEEQLGAMLSSSWLGKIYAQVQRLEPGIGEVAQITDYLLPPYQDPLTAVHAALRARLPATRYHTVICVPWIRTGGADLVAGLLAAALLRIRPAERVLILRTDNPHFERADWLPEAADCVDMSDLRAALSEPEAQTLLRVLFRGVAAQRVFNVNSRLCWTSLRDNHANMAASHANYAYLFCWDQTPDGRRVGYPAEFFADTVASITGFLTDTEYLKTELTAQYRLAPLMQGKILPLATPMQASLRSVAIAREIAQATVPPAPCVLWAGRLDRQKRFDLVCDIALLMPDVVFRCWGAPLLDAPPDLTQLPANMVMEGIFESFDELPLSEAGAWLFTSSWEGLPTTIIELAVRGVAVVASAVGGVPELIGPDTGWPVPPEAEAADYAVALRAALADPRGAAERAEALQRRVAERHASVAYDAALARLLDQEIVQ